MGWKVVVEIRKLVVVGVGKPGLKVTIEKDSVSWDGDDEEVEGTDRE